VPVTISVLLVSNSKASNAIPVQLDGCTRACSAADEPGKARHPLLRVRSDSFSQKTIKALIDKTEPIHPPCCAEMLHIKGTLVLSIAVGSNGEVICVEYVSGHLLLIGVAIDSLRRWDFRPHAVKGQKRKFCRRIGLRYEANEVAVKYEVI